MTQSAIGYVSKSFDDPDHRTSSVDDQRVFAQAYARQHGMDLISFHSDDGISGATMERPGLQAALTALKAGKATRGGATGGRILVYVKEVLGLDVSDRPMDRLALCEEEAALVLRIYKLYADGYSLKDICKILNEEGVASPRARVRGVNIIAGSGIPRPCPAIRRWARAFSTTKSISVGASSTDGSGSRYPMTSAVTHAFRASIPRANGWSGTSRISSSSTMHYGIR